MLTRAAVIERLASAGCVAAEREADELLAAAPDDATLETWLRRREQGEPPAWITGTTSFCGRPLHVAPGVYVPRAQTEELARRAAALLPASGTAVDLCTGAGAIAAHLRAEVPTATVVGVDIDPLAAACAKRNGVPAIMGDIARPLRTDPRVDLVTAVAPYVPTGAIEFLPADVQAPRAEARARRRGRRPGPRRRVVTAAADLLDKGAWLLIEVGGDQADAFDQALVHVGSPASSTGPMTTATSGGSRPRRTRQAGRASKDPVAT